MPVDIDVHLVRRLIADQFPQWSHLEVVPVEPGGWDNRTFRLGDRLSVRLPSAAAYADQVAKEQRWLPRLAPHLPLPIPDPVAEGKPGSGYPWPWSVLRWIDGEVATDLDPVELVCLADDLAGFLAALQAIDLGGGPPPGKHNCFRGGCVSSYDAETRRALDRLAGRIDTAGASRVWEAALESGERGPPVWIHGDVSAENLLVADGRLCAVIDFGCAAVGDPACDLTIAWTLFAGTSREIFRQRLALPDGTWVRARGWALWKGLITLVEHLEGDIGQWNSAHQVVEELLAETGRG